MSASDTVLYDFVILHTPLSLPRAHTFFPSWWIWNRSWIMVYMLPSYTQMNDNFSRIDSLSLYESAFSTNVTHYLRSFILHQHPKRIFPASATKKSSRVILCIHPVNSIIHSLLWWSVEEKLCFASEMIQYFQANVSFLPSNLLPIWQL